MFNILRRGSFIKFSASIPIYQICKHFYDANIRALCLKYCTYSLITCNVRFAFGQFKIACAN